MSEHPHALPKNKHRRDGQLDRLLPQTSAVTTADPAAMRMSPRPHVSFLGGSGFTRGRPPMAQLLGQVWKEPCRHTGGEGGRRARGQSQPCQNTNTAESIMNQRRDATLHHPARGAQRPRWSAGWNVAKPERSLAFWKKPFASALKLDYS